MFFLPGIERAVVSPSDLRRAADCEWALITRFDVALGRRAAVASQDDPVMKRAAALGDAHEQMVLRELIRDRAGRVVQIPRPRAADPESYAAADAATLTALRSPDCDVVYQAVFSDERFLGFADFIVRGADGSWQVWDTKLARHAGVPALLQIAAYADHLAGRGVPLSPEAVLVLGSGDRQSFPLRDIVPVYRSRRTRLLDLLDQHQDDDGAARWGDPRWHACGRCDPCHEELVVHSDVLLVAGVRATQRKRLNAAGVATVVQLAAREDAVPELPDRTLSRLRAQARLQLQQQATGAVSAEVHTPDALAAVPAPSPGDIFFDFEGDPLWREPGSPSWGLEYLFGVVEAPVGEDPPVFRPFWAHDRQAEKQALVDFIAYVRARRELHPDLHIYHYAAYERSRLLSLAARHSVCEEDVDTLLRQGVLVDLYAVVKSAIRVSQDSYSIKKLEPLYMGQDLRVGEVKAGGDSIEVYHQFVQARLEGRVVEADRLLEEIRAYNEYDCVSTLRLRDWLLAQAAAHAVTIRPAVHDVADAEQPHPLEAELRELLGPATGGPRTDDQQALAMVAATIQYHRREHKPFWWSHFDRLRNPVDEWIAAADVFHVESAVVDPRGWFKEGRQRSLRRVLTLTGSFGPGGRVPTPPETRYALYDPPVPEGMPTTGPADRAAARDETITDVEELGDGRHRITVTEILAKDVLPHDRLPRALTPQGPPNTARIDKALSEIGESVARSWPVLPATAGLDLLRRLTPRLLGGEALPQVGAGDDRFVDAIREAVLALDDSYLAVQGPPGTGKTYVGANVIAALVNHHGWRVGVVAQSHAAIENVLDAVVKAGVPGDLVAKRAHHRQAPTWTDLPHTALASFAADHADTGYVIGGTAFDFAHEDRVARGQLDLLVIDEAGQYSLAATLACSVATHRLLLLGDPQQLAQVSQGTHAEPVNESALGWVIEGRPILPASRGYFLETTWRLHPALADKVSQLSYAGSLGSQTSVTLARRLEGLAPGLHVVPLGHRDNATDSVEEAEEVARRILGLLGAEWTDPDESSPRPLQQSDIRVVTPYNNQVALLRRVLDAAGLEKVPVGTVDKFQGQEGAVVFVSMAASARSDVSRGVGFLLDRNRLNVSISRGKWAAFIVCSDVLTDFTPATPDELLLLGAFMHLTGLGSATAIARP